MRRREFIRLLGGAAAWPPAAQAQPSAMPVIGYLTAGKFMEGESAGFQQGLKETGLVEDRDFAIEYHSTSGQLSRLPAIIADVVARRVTMIVAVSDPYAQAAKAATTTIPIVFIGGGDPVRIGLVTSLNRPSGNVTGVTVLNVEIAAKRLQLPIAQGQLEPVVVGPSPFFNIHSQQLAALMVRHRLPAIFQTREFVAAGGLMSYGGSLLDVFRIAGTYTGRILKGDRPGSLPVQQASKFEFFINLKTAKALDLAVPPTLVAVADEVIE